MNRQDAAVATARSGTASAIRILDETTVAVSSVARAGTLLSGLDENTLLHAGPPLRRLPSGPLLTSLAGALRLSSPGLTAVAARKRIQQGDVRLLSAHEHGAVLPAAGALSRDMAVVEVTSSRGHRAVCPLNEGAGATLRFGFDGDATLDRLRWMADVAAPALHTTLVDLDLTAVLATSLRRGDECHGHTAAGRDILLLAAARSAAWSDKVSGWAQVLNWAADNVHFFNSFAVAAARVLAMAAADVPNSRLVTAICSNGQDLGVRAEGISNRWFTCESPLPSSHNWPTRPLPHPLIGDSFAMEVIGLGAAALDASPASCGYFGLRPDDVAAVISHTSSLSSGVSRRWLVPQRDFAGTALGLHLDLISASQQGPAVDHAVIDATQGQLGAAISYLPTEPFADCARQELQ